MKRFAWLLPAVMWSLATVTWALDISLYAPTPLPVAQRMLELAEVKKTDVVYDLGSGDGRIVILASRLYGCRSVGIEWDAKLVDRARRNVERNGVAPLCEIRQDDVLEAEVADADVVTLYLMPDLLAKLLPQLEALRDGARIVCYSKALPGVTPEAEHQVKTGMGDETQPIYLYRLPLKKAACASGTCSGGT